MAMNNPFRDLKSEIKFLKEVGVDAMELTIEPPESYFEQTKHIHELKDFCSVGHTRIDLEFANTDEKVRQRALNEFEKALDFFQSIGIQLVNFHPDKGESGLTEKAIWQNNISSLQAACILAENKGITIMIENQNPFPFAQQYTEVFESVPAATLLFDVAHAYYLGGEQNVRSFVDIHARKIRHVHLCDNRGANDDHLFIGKGNIGFSFFIPEICKHTDELVSFSLEPFMIDDKLKGLRLATQQEREELLPESVHIVRSILKKY